MWLFCLRNHILFCMIFRWLSVKRQNPSSTTFQDCCWSLGVHSKHFCAVPTAGSDLTSYRISHQPGLTFNQSRCKGVFMGQIDSGSPRKKIFFFILRTSVQMYKDCPCMLLYAQQGLEPSCSKSTQAYEPAGNPMHTPRCIYSASTEDIVTLLESLTPHTVQGCMATLRKSDPQGKRGLLSR